MKRFKSVHFKSETFITERNHRTLLPVFVTLGSVCLEVLVVKGEMHPLGHIVMDGSIKLEAETVP